MIVKPDNIPTISREFDAIMIWMDDIDMSAFHRYDIKHTTNKVSGFIEPVYIIDPNT